MYTKDIEYEATGMQMFVVLTCQISKFKFSEVVMNDLSLYISVFYANVPCHA